ncbi:HSP70 family protein [Aspergillus terreus]|uniref:HSP70 family protein n=1 Tax=Aspergillus terreus TaxID=33178 RepID=A0A5M3ZBH3_ASPTE|nr:hypothetical protein ATETN484_0013010800 [Aspergillus terreus]GFF20342.1 HSP70 family protein [Aspergillus terreus]
MNMEDLTIPQPVGFHRAETDGPAESDSQQCRRFVVGLDFGTTFSSVSVACVQQTDDGKDIEVQPFDIWSVCDYPDSPSMYNDNRADVPTECFYPAGAPYREPIMHLNMTYHEDGTLRKKSTERESNESSVDCQVDGNMEHTDGEPDFMDIDMPLGDYYWGYELQNEKIIGNKRETDIIADYLERVFQHTKEQMENRHEYKEGEPVEFALCIPAIWTRKACRTMQQAMTAALHRVRFITDKFHDVSNLFIVHEPEAASAYVLAHNKEKDIMAGESFVLLDAGGGTVDTITYKVASNLPLRLEREAVAPSGALCGSSYLNEDFRKFIQRRLGEETYLQNLDAKIDMIMEQFENDIKRNFNPARNTYAVRVLIDNLRENKEKGFKAGKMHITKKDMTEVFDGCLKRTAQLMLDQILQAEANNIFVKKVVLIGGFAASHALSQHLNNELREYSKRAGRAIQLRVPKFPGTAVASGAVLCALKKEDAPARTIFSSYGLKITEPFDNANPAHVEQIKSRQPDPNDRKPCIRDTILWFVNKGDVLSSKWEYTLPVNLTFTERQNFTFTQVLYVSDRNHRSSYREDHEENEGKEEAGRIDVDMTYLKDKGLVQCTKVRGRRPYYLIEFDLVIIVDGRNLTFEARHPYGSEGDHERGQISIAAAFLENPDAASAP